MTLRRWALALWASALALVVQTPSGARDDVASRVRALIAGLDLDQARRELAAADPTDPHVAIERARLALYELDCDGAATILARREVQAIEGSEPLVDVARGCQRATAALVSDVDDVHGIQIYWQDEHDRVLAPLLFETAVAAREALTAHLGVDWPRPTRIVVVRDLLSLSAMTGLPYDSARTTGTAAIAKWGRITLLSPRASHHGFAWQDTVAHELAHLAITRASRDRAPLWLQEGVAKREEVRWREPGPFDDRPPVDATVARGMDQGLTLPLDKLGPSIAMLPSADAAAVAFAEVTSFVRFYAQDDGDAKLRSLMRWLGEGQQPDQALVSASGLDLEGWDARWRAYIASRPRVSAPQLMGLGGKGAGDPASLRDLRDRARLAQLLLSGGHPDRALDELARINLAGSPVGQEAWEHATGDPGIRWLRGRALELAGRRPEGEALVADPKDVLSSYGPWWAMRGRWARLRGDEPAATASFFQAVAADPLDGEAACESVDESDSPPDASSRPALCAAARAWPEPPFDAD